MAENTEHTFEELHQMTVAQLKEIAKGIEHDALHGYATMHKDQLVPALCEALGIEAHAHHEVMGIDTSAIKARILHIVDVARSQHKIEVSPVDGGDEVGFDSRDRTPVVGIAGAWVERILGYVRAGQIQCYERLRRTFELVVDTKICASR